MPPTPVDADQVTATTVTPTLPPVTVISTTHYLLPLAWRLVREGFEVQVAIAHALPKYEEAWAGKFTKFLKVRKGAPREDTVKAVREAVEERQALVVTDSVAWTKRLAGYGRLFGNLSRVDEHKQIRPLAVGAWFDGTGFSGHHLLVRDLGVWTGGMGPMVPGGVTLVAGAMPPGGVEALEELRPKLDGFKGHVTVDLEVDVDEKVARPTGTWRAGWYLLDAHAFVAEQPSVGGLMAGYEPVFEKKYTVVLPVSVPPWPLECNIQPEQVPIGARRTQENPDGVLRPQDTSNIFFHDMKMVGDVPTTVGLDGLVGVVRGSHNLLAGAKHRALALAEHLRLPEKQFRADVGGATEQVLMVLEELGLGVV